MNSPPIRSGASPDVAKPTLQQTKSGDLRQQCDRAHDQRWTGAQPHDPRGEEREDEIRQPFGRDRPREHVECVVREEPPRLDQREVGGQCPD